MEGRPPNDQSPEAGRPPPKPEAAEGVPPAAPRRPRPVSDIDTTVAILLAVAVVLAALIGARAGLLGDDGSDTWHSAVREDVKRATGMTESIRFVYQEDAPNAVQILEAEIRAKELRRAARNQSGQTASMLRAEASAQEKLAETNKPASEIASDPKYANGKGGYDVVERLAERRAEQPELVELDPDAKENRGSDRTRESALLVAATILVAIAFFLGALAEGFGHWRRRLVPAGFVFAGLGLVMALVIEVSL